MYTAAQKIRSSLAGCACQNIIFEIRVYVNLGMARVSDKVERSSNQSNKTKPRKKYKKKVKNCIHLVGTPFHWITNLGRYLG